MLYLKEKKKVVKTPLTDQMQFRKTTENEHANTHNYMVSRSLLPYAYCQSKKQTSSKEKQIANDTLQPRMTHTSG